MSPLTFTKKKKASHVATFKATIVATSAFGDREDLMCTRIKYGNLPSPHHLQLLLF
jgi:hypothetical protein